MKCKDCEYLTNDGKCKVSARSHREFPGYFDEACSAFTAPGSVQLEPMKQTKVCKGCGRELPLEEFVKHWRGSYIGYCKDCWAEKMKGVRAEAGRKGGIAARGKSGRKAKTKTKDEQPEAPKPAKAKAPKERPKPLRREDIATAPLEDLLQELNRRGYGVTISK